MKDNDNVFHTNFSTILTEDHMLNLFQEIPYLLPLQSWLVNQIRDEKAKEQDLQSLALLQLGGVQ